MKNKIYIFFITILSIFVVFLILNKLNINANINKLKASINESDITGSITINCGKTTLNVNEETTCTMVGVLNDNITSITGKLEASSNLQISNITKSSNWQGDSNSEYILYYSDPQPAGQFNIATFTLKALSSGSGTVKLTKYVDSSNDKVLVSIGYETNWGVKEVNEPTVSITVNSSTPTPKSTNANLSGLSVTVPPLTANKITNFNTNTTSYTVSVPSDTIIVSVVATKADSKATVSITDNGSINMTSVSSKVVNVLVTAENGTTKKTYTVTINKQIQEQKSTDSRLKSLTVTGATITPTFSKDVLSYSAVVPNGVSSITIGAQPNDTKATVTGTGTKDLIVGSNEFNIKVTAEDTNYKQTYVVRVEREAPIEEEKSSVNTLKELTISNATLSPAFNKDIINYTATIDSNITRVNIKATPTDTKATVTGTGEKTLFGNDSFSVTVTAENNSKKIYTINVKVKENSSTNCTDLKLISSVYKIDNDKQIIYNVNKDHNIGTIRNNISSTCGTIMVNDEKIILSSDTQIKEYKIERVWIPQTGQNVVKYALVIVIIAGILGALLFIKKKLDK